MYHILCNYIVKYDINCFLKGIENMYVEKKQYEVKKITESHFCILYEAAQVMLIITTTRGTAICFDT